MKLDRIDEFLTFVAKEIEPAVKDLGNLAEKNRIHIQKLVYTNLVDRFDTMVDVTILENCRESMLVDTALKNANDPISEGELFRLLLQSDNINEIIEKKLQDGLRNTVLRQRHSRKLATLFDVCAPDFADHSTVPKVNVNTGEIVEKFKPQYKTTPHSVCGYADWIYSRRNAIVHGAGASKFLQNDVAQLKSIYKCDVSKTWKIKLGSLSVTIKFYRAVAAIIKDGHLP